MVEIQGSYTKNDCVKTVDENDAWLLKWELSA